jgi:hypothetical protein
MNRACSILRPPMHGWHLHFSPGEQEQRRIDPQTGQYGRRDDRVAPGMPRNRHRGRLQPSSLPLTLCVGGARRNPAATAVDRHERKEYRATPRSGIFASCRRLSARAAPILSFQ